MERVNVINSSPVRPCAPSYTHNTHDPTFPTKLPPHKNNNNAVHSHIPPKPHKTPTPPPKKKKTTPTTPTTLQAAVVLFFVGMALLSLVHGPDYNPFSRVHHLLYLLLGIPLAPATEERLKAQRAAVVTTPTRPAKPATAGGGSVLMRPKVLVPLLAVLYYQYRARVPRTSLPAGGRLHPGEYIQVGGRLAGCL